MWRCLKILPVAPPLILSVPSLKYRRHSKTILPVIEHFRPHYCCAVSGHRRKKRKKQEGGGGLGGTTDRTEWNQSCCQCSDVTFSQNKICIKAVQQTVQPICCCNFLWTKDEARWVKPSQKRFVSSFHTAQKWRHFWRTVGPFSLR